MTGQLKRRIDLVGATFGRLIVICYSHTKKNVAFWSCRCECGNEIKVRANSLLKNNTRSCGCLKRDVLREAKTTHGQTRTPEHQTWLHIKERCTNPKVSNYSTYGGRGIYVCDRWLNSFENFLADMGLRPPGNSIDRIDNDGPYSPENCRWATRTEQNRNQSSNNIIQWNGKAMCMSAWAEEKGIGRSTLKMRIKRYGIERGMSMKGRVGCV